jgi:hypothetical protein
VTTPRAKFIRALYGAAAVRAKTGCFALAGAAAIGQGHLELIIWRGDFSRDDSRAVDLPRSAALTIQLTRSNSGFQALFCLVLLPGWRLFFSPKLIDLA